MLQPGFKRDTVWFLPLLILYIGIVLTFSANELRGDEIRYVNYAKSLTMGFYSPPPPHVYLVNGPAYPLILYPFVAMNLPYLLPKLMNAIFLFLAVLFLFHSLQFYVERKQALVIALIAGLYWPPFQLLPALYTESVTILLISLFTFFFLRAFRLNGQRDLVLAAFSFAVLALTKMIFGHVITTGILLSFFVWIISKNKMVRKVFLMFVFALGFCLPYLIYTYSLTGKILYWSSPFGTSLYYMSSPHKTEFGEWYGDILVDKNKWIKKGLVGEDHELFLLNHSQIIQLTDSLPYEDGEKLYLEAAFQNIRNYPYKYIRNWFTNVSRMLFSYPYGYRRMEIRTFFTLLPNMFVFVLGVVFLFPSFLYFRKIPREIVILLMIFLVYLGASSLVTSFSRQFYILYPVFTVWFAFCIRHFLRIAYRT
jgi:hypothetical protein